MNKSILDKQLEIDKIQKGTSVALFYKNIDAYIKLMMPFILDGLCKNEKIVLIINDDKLLYADEQNKKLFFEKIN